MGFEARRRPSPEQCPKPGDIPVAFAAAAHSTFYSLTADPHLHEKLILGRVNPYEDADQSKYWQVVAEHSKERINAIRANTGNTLKISALELLAATPHFLHAHHYLDTHPVNAANNRDNMGQVRLARTTVSAYNDIVRQFAFDFPHARTVDVTRGLLAIVNKAIAIPEVRQNSARMVERHIHGSRHEIAFGQILGHTDWSGRTTTVSEDLGGADYIARKGSNTLRVNVKASNINIRDEDGYNGIFAFTPGHVRICSLVGDADFHGGFFIDDDLAQGWAPTLNALLDCAVQQRVTPAPVLRYSA